MFESLNIWLKEAIAPSPVAALRLCKYGKIGQSAAWRAVKASSGGVTAP